MRSPCWPMELVEMVELALPPAAGVLGSEYGVATRAWSSLQQPQPAAIELAERDTRWLRTQRQV